MTLRRALVLHGCVADAEVSRQDGPDAGGREICGVGGFGDVGLEAQVI